MENSVFSAGFVAVPNALRPSGIYCLLLRGDVVYIGKSTDVYARLSRHRQNQARWKTGKQPYNRSTMPKIEFDSVLVKFVPPAALDREELTLIQRFMPKHNQRLVRPEYKVDITLIPGIAEILNRVKVKSGVPATYYKRSMRLDATP